MKKLRIGIDINEANVKERVGTGQYTFHILKYMNQHEDYDFHLYHRDPILGDLPPENNHWHYHQVSPSRAWIKFSLPLYLLTHAKNDIFWSPAHYMPSLTRCPSVVTIHDLAYEFFPTLFLKSDLYKLKNWTKSSVEKASKIIAVSEATKNDLENLYGTDSHKIQVIHNGYDSDIFNTTLQPNNEILGRYDLEPNNFILFLGTIQPRKNAIKLVQAFHLLKEQGYLGKLVLAGGIGWLADETLSVIKNSKHNKDILLTGYISDQARKGLYANCDAYVLPSLYEGFGVPAIEAMACGAPVAVSNNSSLPEVVGDAGVLFDPHDPASIMNSIFRLKADRSTWIKKSLARAKHFSWEKCAEETLKALV